MDKSDLAVRMKQYEEVNRRYLTKRMPVIIRIDGKAFHTFCKGFEKPFDYVLAGAMQDTMKYLCENIQGCVFGYTQSDEITLILIDYKKINSGAWFDDCQNKIESVSASMATMYFNKSFEYRVLSHHMKFCNKYDREKDRFCKTLADEGKLMSIYEKVNRSAVFDSRAFNIPKEDVCNNILWRQQDATRNSVQLAGQANFPCKELEGKSCAEIQDMLMIQKSINWNDFPTFFKRGSCCIKNYWISDNYNETQEDTEGAIMKSRWIIDKEIPIFSKNRNYIESRVFI